MAGIKVVAALVRCAADLLICDDIDTARLRFTDAENCRNALPAIIGELQRRGAPDQVVMGRCRFMTDSGPAPTTDHAHRDKPGIGVDVAATGDSIAPSAPSAIIGEPQRRGALDQVVKGRCRITTDSGPAPTTDPVPGIGLDVAAAGDSIAPSAPPAIIGEPQRRGAPDQTMGRCRIMSDSGPAPTTDSAHRAKPGFGVDVAAVGGSVAP
jgi:hypothetical protein